MQTLEQANHDAASLYRLAYLLTGQREISVDVTLETLDQEHTDNAFFATWMLAWSRRVVIGKALAAVRTELATSLQRISSARVRKAALPSRDWALQHDASGPDLEQALLAIDIFPRCVLLLMVFEKISMDDAVVLLDAGPDLIRKARTAGLQELASNIARTQGWKSTAAPRCFFSDLLHA